MRLLHLHIRWVKQADLYGSAHHQIWKPIRLDRPRRYPARVTAVVAVAHAHRIGQAVQLHNAPWWRRFEIEVVFAGEDLRHGFSIITAEGN